MRTVTRIALVIVLAGACKKETAAPPPGPPTSDLEMVSHGAMPHQTRRYQLTRGVKTAVEMEVDVDIATPSFQRTIPTTVTVMELGAEDVLPDGNARVRTRILRTSARERPGAQVSPEMVNAQATMLNGLEITGTLTARGKLEGPQLAGSASLPAKAADGLAALIAQADEVAMPLPEPAVGVGAIWRVRRDAVQLGIKLETVTEIEVTALEDQRVAYAMRTQVKGDNQRATIEGVTVDVTNVRGNGTGKGVIDLGRMVMLGEQAFELGFDIAAMDQSGSVKMRTAKRLKPAADAGAATAAPAPPPPDAGAPRGPEKPPDPGAH